MRVGEGLLSRTLPRAEWTHEAHLAATLYLLTRRPEIDLHADLPAIIRGYNAAVDGVNDDRQGYHDTVTKAYLAGTRWLVVESGHRGLLEMVNALLVSPVGSRNWPLRFYSRERLFSIEARRTFVEPDLLPLP